MLGTFSPPPLVSDPDMHHGTCVTHVPWCMPGWLTSGFLWSRWRGKLSRQSRRMRNPQFCVSGKRPIGLHNGGQLPVQYAIDNTTFTLQVQTGFCGCTPDSGGTTGFWWCIYRNLLVHLGWNGWRSGCTMQKHGHTGACCVENEVTKMCIW